MLSWYWLLIAELVADLADALSQGG